jgi:hypothetical protein
MAQSNTKIDTKMVKWDESPKLDPKMVKWDEAKAPNPTDDMSGTERVVAGYGKAAMDTYRGLRQFHGLMSPVSRFYNEATGLQGQIDEAKKTDKALMDTSGGFWGNIAGNVANLLPTAFLPGSATVPGSALVGSLTGAIQPVASDESRAQNAAVGGVLGPVATLAGRGAGALWQGGKALVEPFSQSGRDKIAGCVLERFIDDGNTLRGATSAATVTGARPTLAEATGDAGAARLQDALRAVDPQINNRISSRLADNNAARVSALEKVAGRDGPKAAAEAARETAGEQLYGAAFKANSALTPSQLAAQEKLLRGGGIEKLLESPAVQEAVKQAQTNAANRGVTMTTDGSIEGLHNVKLAIDDMIKDPATAAQAAKMAGLKAARNRVVNVIETLSPDYKSARKSYAKLSKPVNAFEIGEEVLKRATSSTSDLAGNPRMQANALLSALRDEPALIQRATGRSGGALSEVLDPANLNLLRSVASESDRAAAVASAGNGPGSATAQRMASQNVLRQILGPTGLPESWSENALANTFIGKPLNLVYGGVAEPRIQQALADAVLDPAKARVLLDAVRANKVQLPPSAVAQLTAQAARLSAPVAAVPGQR